MGSSNIDMAAAGRVASRVNLSEIRLAHLGATRSDVPAGLLEPHVEPRCSLVKNAPPEIVLECKYDFKVVAGGKSVVAINATYVLFYRLNSATKVEKADLDHFCVANGLYHSWPFARELFHSMTGRMGLPPYTLPVLLFKSPESASRSLQPTTPRIKSSVPR